MSEQKPKMKRPSRGLKRWFFRAPIWLYHNGLGGLMGGRFLLLNHVGRKSGLPRQAVVEVTKFDPETGIYYIASGWGKKSDWYLNLLKTPETTIQVRRKKMAVTAVPLTPEESADLMADYARRYPKAARNLSKLVGYEVGDGREEDYRQVGQNIPFVALQPRSAKSEAAA